MEINDLLHAILPGLVAATLTGVIMQWLYSGASREVPKKIAGARLYTYGKRTRNVMTIVGVLSILFAVIPITLIYLKYFNHVPGTPRRYDPVGDTIAGICLFIGFGISAIVCLIDPRKYYARTDEKGITVRGLFFGTKFCRWADIKQMKDFPRLRMFRLYGVSTKGEVKMWIPHTLNGLGRLLQEINEHGVLLEEQENQIGPAREYLASLGHTKAKIVHMFLPFMTIWKLPSTEPDKLAIVLFGFTAEAEPKFVCHEATGAASAVLEDIKIRLQNRTFEFDPEFQSELASDISQIISQIEASE